MTAKLAKRLADSIGADLHEIKPEKPYTDADLNWNNKSSRSSIEMDDKSFRPAIVGKVDNMSGMGNTNRELAPSCPGAALKDGKRFETSISTDKLKTWAEKFI